jgi:BlaI family penicillinase repressor
MRTSLPTPAELAILRVLWTRGPSTVREIHTQLGTETGYTTVLRTVQTMTEKGLVSPDKTSHAHIFAATAPASEVLAQLLENLLDRGFGGEAGEFLKAARAVAESKDRSREPK